jgi:hypothetical protein
MAALLALCGAVTAPAEDVPGYSEAYPALLDPFTGNWEGKWTEGDEKDPALAAQIVPLGKDKYRITLVNLLDVRCPALHTTEVTATGGRLEFRNDALFGTIADGVFAGGKVKDENRFRLERVERASATLGMPPPPNAVVLFDGSSLDRFRNPKGWVITPEGTLLVTPKSPDVSTNDRFADVQLHLEFRMPYRPDKRGQDRGNSGVFLQNTYEIQILDSFGLDGLYDECGAVYKIAAPRANVCRPPLQWQTYDITYHAPRFDAQGKLAELGRVSVLQNDIPIHTEQQLLWPTSGGGNKRTKPHPDKPQPIRIQEHGDFMEFRNIWLVEIPRG